MEKRPLLEYAIVIKLLKSKGIENPSYEDLLWTQEWYQFRDRILERDNQTCTKCSLSRYRKMSDEEFAKTLASSGFGKYFNLMTGDYEDTPGEFSLRKNNDYPSEFAFDNSIRLEVHHKYYIWKKLPWEYNLDALTTLCEQCHHDEHFTVKRIIYANDFLTEEKRLNQCNRCNGIGYLEEYRHVQNGICFACWGYGGVEQI